MLRQILIFKSVRIIYAFVAYLIVLNLDAYDQIIAYVKMLMTKLLTINHGLLTHSFQARERDDKSSSVDLVMYDTEDDKCSSINLKMFDTENSNASDPDDCCHHIEKVSTSIQMFSIFITSLMITN
jgi:hypothetical protein